MENLIFCAVSSYFVEHFSITAFVCETKHII